MPPTVPESTSEPIAEYEAEFSSPEPSSLPNPEPLPDWNIALAEWKALWQIHYIGFGALFSALTIFSCFCLVRIVLSHRSKMSLKNYFVVVCALLLTMSLSRALYLLLDPYEAHDVLNLPVLVPRVIIAIGYPCLTSAFSLLHFAFLEVSKLRLISRRLQNIKFLCSVIVTHFLFVLAVYVIITFYPTLARLLIICQSILVCWWLVLCACFLYSGWKVNWQASLTRKFFIRKYKRGKQDNDSALKESSPENLNREGTKKIGRISGIVVVIALISVALELYSLFGVYDCYKLPEGSVIEPWPWFAYQTCLRVIEFILCCVIAYVIYPTVHTRKKSEETHSMSATSHYSVASKKNLQIRSSPKMSAASLNKVRVVVL